MPDAATATEKNRHILRFSPTPRALTQPTKRGRVGTDKTRRIVYNPRVVQFVGKLMGLWETRTPAGKRQQRRARENKQFQHRLLAARDANSWPAPENTRPNGNGASADG